MWGRSDDVAGLQRILPLGEVLLIVQIYGEVPIREEIVPKAAARIDLNRR